MRPILTPFCLFLCFVFNLFWVGLSGFIATESSEVTHPEFDLTRPSSSHLGHYPAVSDKIYVKMLANNNNYTVLRVWFCVVANLMWCSISEFSNTRKFGKSSSFNCKQYRSRYHQEIQNSFTFLSISFIQRASTINNLCPNANWSLPFYLAKYFIKNIKKYIVIANQYNND